MSSSSKSIKTANKSKKVPSISSEPSVPTWLQEESSASEMSDSSDPWLSGSADVEEVTATSSGDVGGCGDASQFSTGSEPSRGKSLKRPRTSSANEQSSKCSEDEVLVEDDHTHSGSDDPCVDDMTHHAGTAAPLATPIPTTTASSSSDSGEDVIIDDCTFSDDDDCIVLDTTGAQPSSNTPSVPSAPSLPPDSSTLPEVSGPDLAESVGSAPFGLDKVIPVDEDTVLITTAPEFRLFLWGAYQVRVLRGAARLHGATLTPARADFLPVFALRVKALPPLRPAETDTTAAAESPPPEELSCLPEQAAAAVRASSGCALLVRRLPSRLFSLLAAQLGDTFTPRAGEDGDLVLAHTGCRLLRTAEEMRQLQLTPHLTNAPWEQQLQRLAASSDSGERLRVTFAGGKGVGKSTWMYHVLNLLLNSRPHVYVLDVDPGQVEFTPCACLSLVKVDSYLVGPSFTHLTKPVRSIFTGEVSVANDPRGYMEAVQQLVGTYRQLARTDPAPLLVNTMGWAKGLGEDLLLEVLGLTQPTDLLEIIHPVKEHVNFATELTSARVNGAGRSWLIQQYLPRGAPGRPAVSYRHCRLASPGLTKEAAPQTSSSSSALAPWMYRQLNTTAFVASLERHGRTLCQLTPVCVPWCSLAVHVATRQVLPQHLMHAINGTVVALCRTDPSCWIPPGEDRSLFSLLPQPHSRPDCLGFALVRGVDASRSLLYLLTDLAPERWGQVNTVIRGPHHLLDVFPSSGLRSWTPALTEDEPTAPLNRPNTRVKKARVGPLRVRGPGRAVF